MDRDEGVPAGPENEEPERGAELDAGEPDGKARLQANKSREVQLARTGGRRLFKGKGRKRFLKWFAATGNVVWSAAKAGYSDKTVWKHRMKDPRFAEAFDRAFEQSVARNKARMLERKAKATPIAVEGGAGEAELGDCDLDKAWPLIVEIERAKARSGGGGGAPIGRPRKAGRAPHAASNARVRSELEKRLRAFGRRVRARGIEPPPWLPPAEGGKAGAPREASVTGSVISPAASPPAPPPGFTPPVASQSASPSGSPPDCRAASPPSPGNPGEEQGGGS